MTLHRSSLYALAASCLLTACDDGTSVKPDGDDTGDPDAVIVDSDDTDGPDDTESDTPVSDTDRATDTFEGGDTDTGVDTDPAPDLVVRTTIPNIHAGIHTPGQTLRIDGSVVTAVRLAANPPATNGFAVQDPSVTENGGLYIHVASSTNLPAVGDVVDLVGLYEEWPATAVPMTDTMARLNILTTLPLTSWTRTGTASLPPAQEVDLATLQQFATAERYESMLVHLSEATPLDVVTNPIATNGEFRVSTVGSADQVIVDTQFFDLRTVFTVNRGDGVNALTGVCYFEVNGYKIAPRGLGDVDTWIDP
ncbi:MAG: hypothetical protein H6733_17220 [Alphaproteobacteria bacterium]|nr:hypothetical protein [Alphaproteobacteria bacterium]